MSLLTVMEDVRASAGAEQIVELGRYRVSSRVGLTAHHEQRSVYHGDRNSLTYFKEHLIAFP